MNKPPKRWWRLWRSSNGRSVSKAIRWCGQCSLIYTMRSRQAAVVSSPYPISFPVSIKAGRFRAHGKKNNKNVPPPPCIPIQLTRRCLPTLPLLLEVSRKPAVPKLDPVPRRLAVRKLSTSSGWLPSSSGWCSMTSTRLSARRISSAARRLFDRREGSMVSPLLCFPPPLALPLDEVDDVL